MSARFRFLVPVLLLAFSGCYTQLRAPGTADGELSPVRDEAVSLPPRVDVYHHFPWSTYGGFYDGLFYHPYRSIWAVRMRLLDAYDPYWMPAWYPEDGYSVWGIWHPAVVLVPDLGYWRVLPPRPEPVATRTAAPRPRIRRAGFGTDIPSARQIRGEPVVTVRASGSKPTESAGQESRQQREDAMSSPAVQPPPSTPPPQKKQVKDDQETSRKETREQKRKAQRRRGGMR